MWENTHENSDSTKRKGGRFALPPYENIPVMDLDDGSRIWRTEMADAEERGEEESSELSPSLLKPK